MEIFSALLAFCVENSVVTDELPSQTPVARNFDVFFDLRLNKRLSKQSRPGDLRRRRAHYSVTVMTCPVKSGMTLLIHSEISTVARELISNFIWLFIMDIIT